MVRSGDIFDLHVDDHLWNIYFMLMENDGMNAAQLIHWANVRVFIDAFVRTRLHEGKDELNNWPLDNQVNALALWIMWHTSNDGMFIPRPFTWRTLNYSNRGSCKRVASTTE